MKQILTHKQAQTVINQYLSDSLNNMKIGSVFLLKVGADGSTDYIMKHTEDEYLLIQNSSDEIDFLQL